MRLLLMIVTLILISNTGIMVDCQGRCEDADEDSKLSTSDAVYIINFVITGVAAPGDCAPGSPEWSGQNCCPF